MKSQTFLVSNSIDKALVEKVQELLKSKLANFGASHGTWEAEEEENNTDYHHTHQIHHAKVMPEMDEPVGMQKVCDGKELGTT